MSVTSWDISSSIKLLACFNNSMSFFLYRANRKKKHSGHRLLSWDVEVCETRKHHATSRTPPTRVEFDIRPLFRSWPTKICIKKIYESGPLEFAFCISKWVYENEKFVAFEHLSIDIAKEKNKPLFQNWEFHVKNELTITSMPNVTNKRNF